MSSPGRFVAPPGVADVGDDTVAWITTDQMRRIDEAMVDDLGIVLLQMMENAGRHLAHLVVTATSPETAIVYVGPGGNGGGGLVAARHLANVGVDVTVVPAQPDTTMSEIARRQLDIVRRIGVRVRPAHRATTPEFGPPVDVAIDALVGYGLTRPLSGPMAHLAEATRTAGSIVSLDVPTGVDATSGRVVEGAVVPDATLTLCLPKLGLADRAVVGELVLADISVPPALSESIGDRGAPPFRHGPILRLVPS